MLIGGPARSSSRTRKRKYTLPSSFKTEAAAAPRRPAPRPAPRPTPRQVTAARAVERSYASQGKQVARQAQRQKRQAKARTVAQAKRTERSYASQHRAIQHAGNRAEVVKYLNAPVPERRKMLTSIRAQPAAVRSRGEGRILDIHAKRHAKDVKTIREVGFLPRARYGYTPKVTKTNVMPAPPKAPKVTKYRTTARGIRVAEVTPNVLGVNLEKAIKNVPKDVGELAIGTPSSIAHVLVKELGAAQNVRKGNLSAAGKTQVDLLKEQVEPYKQLYKNPAKFIEQHPVTAGLMVSPAGRLPKLAAGKTARTIGPKKVRQAQSLERPPAVLPGTTIRQHRVGSRDAEKRARQAREDKNNPQPHIRTKRDVAHPISELDRRVDEFEDWAQQQKVATVASATRQVGKKIRKQEGGRVKRTAKRVRVMSPSKQTRERHRTERTARRAEVEEKLSGAKAGARQHTARELVREFGSHWQVVPGVSGKPAVRKYKPEDAPEGSGVIHASREDAKRVVEALERDKNVPWTPRIVELEGDTPGETAGFGVIPDEVADRIAAHGRVGRKGYVVGPGLRGGSRMFRQTVLPVSTKWLGGQVVEGAVRSMAHSGSPLPVLPAIRGRRFLKAYEREHGKPAADALRMRAVSGGQFGVTGPATEYARQLRGEGKTWEAEFDKTAWAPIGKAATRAGKLPVVKQARGAYRKYAETVFGDINGPIERFYKAGMLGKEVKKQSPVLDRKIVGLTSKALDEAARGMRGTSAQVELGRAVDRAYGKYSKHSPEFRDTIMHTTPFIPWMRNMGQFLLTVMPRDHPVAASLTASLNAADQEWRKRHRLSFYGKDQVPSWIMGSYPSGKDKYVPAGRYMPFLPGEFTGAAASQVYPQFFGVLQNLSGVDWKGQKIEGGEGAKAANAALTAAEALIPLVGVASRTTGLGERYVRGKKDKPTLWSEGEKGERRKKVDRAVLDLINPVKPIGITPERKRKKKTGGFGGSGFGSGGFGSSGLR